ncbi:MAG: Hpt domain-containing protein [Bacteroidales bacterium]
MEKINVSYLEEVCGGDKEIITEMVNIFRDQIPEFIEGMRSHYEKEEFPELGLLAHKAKSSIAIMGMEDLALRLKELELKAKAGEEREKYSWYINDFIDQTNQALKEIDEYLKGL